LSLSDLRDCLRDLILPLQRPLVFFCFPELCCQFGVVISFLFGYETIIGHLLGFWGVLVPLEEVAHQL
jgi:hypothetical protein